MNSDKQLRRAEVTYRNLCKALDKIDCKYEKSDDKLSVQFTANGNDIPMPCLMHVDPVRQQISLLSVIPVTVEQDKRCELAIATSYANYNLADGNFDLDLERGTITFRVTSSFRDSVINNNLFYYMVQCAGAVVDKYNDKFMALNKGEMTIEEFIEGK